jgi:translocation protein SEC63
LVPFVVLLQNPDPKAHAYFASYVSKAYAALTDEVSRQNYEKYGHPDGHQVRPLE